MNLTIDIGNTCTKLVAFDGITPVEELRIDDNEWYKLSAFCEKFHFEKGIFSSVIELKEEMISSITALTFPIIRLISGVTPIPLKNLYDTPETLGTDRLAAAVGAYYKNPYSDVLIIDVGTCITYDLVTSSAEFLGGNISPGPKIRFKALNTFTNKLPLVNRKGEVSLWGTSTETAIRNGVMQGIKYEIEGFINEFVMKYPNIVVYLTGGIHIDLDKSIYSKIIKDSFIVPEGLNRILLYNNKINE